MVTLAPTYMVLEVGTQLLYAYEQRQQQESYYTTAEITVETSVF